MMNFGGGSKKATAQVEKWVRKQLQTGVLQADPGLQVIAKEVRCNEPDCVPIETLLILVSSLPSATAGGKSWRWTGKILKPIAEVEQEDVLQLELPVSMEVKEEDEGEEGQEEEEAAGQDAAPAVAADQENATAVPPEQVQGQGQEQGQEQGHERAQELEQAQDQAPPAAKAAAAAGPRTGPGVGLGGVNTALRPGKTAPKSVFRLNAVDAEEQKLEQKEAHKKGVRPRGCPCCDPDNLDNIIDNFMFNI